MNISNKAISPIIATILLIAITVTIAITTFQYLQTYSEDTLGSINSNQILDGLNTRVVDTNGDRSYIQTPYDNLNISKVLLDGVECVSNEGVATSRTLQINLSSCSSNVTSSSPILTIETDQGIIQQDLSIRELEVASQVSSTKLSVVESDGNFELLSSGVVDCSLASVGDTGTLSGVTYTAVSNQNLSDKIESDDTNYYETACTSLVTDMNFADFFAGGVFYNTNINPNISHWDTSSVTDMSYMFRSSSFNQSLDNFDTSSVTNMRSMFYYSSSFNQPLDNFDTSSVTDMFRMLSNTDFFNQSLNSFDTSNVVDMGSMFDGASSFNQPLDNFDTNSVTNMRSMFSGASSFNRPLDNFNTSNVTNMILMFNYASSFNQPLDNFDTSSVTYMTRMFNSASFFDQDISSWCVEDLSEPTDFDTNSGFEGESAKQPNWGATC